MTQIQDLKISCIKLHGYKIELSENIQGKPVARYYRLLTAGKNKDTYKLMNGYYFPTEEKRIDYVNKVLAVIKKEVADKEQNIAAKKQVMANMNHGFEVGQIYYDSWGYDQTNIDFYEIVEVKQKSVVIRPIAGKTVETGFMSGYKTPLPGKYTGEAQLKPVKFYIKKDTQQPVFHLVSRHGWFSKYEKGDTGISCSWYA
jgi:hypothetical protein